jgi:ribose transport system permease protein
MPARLRALFRFQESGLLLVILALGALLTAFAGTVRTPVFERTADGTRTRVYTTDAAGERVPLTIEKNKFLNAQNLAQLAKDTSFIAIMAVGMALVIISGGIDLTVGSIYALASVAGALVLRHFGAEGPAASSPVLGILLGTGTCLGIAALCGLASGSLIVALRVHPFIITLGGMAIYRGIAFVITEGQSIGSFPAAFREFVRFEVGDGLGVVPLATMLVVLFVGWIFLSRLADASTPSAATSSPRVSPVSASSGSNWASTSSPACARASPPCSRSVTTARPPPATAKATSSTSLPLPSSAAPVSTAAEAPLSGLSSAH